MNVLITGGSKGLGYALAETLGTQGARIALVARTEAPLTEAEGRLRAQGIDATAILGDVAHKEDIHRIVGLAHAALGQLDLVIHNAATLGPSGPMPLLGDLECEAFEHVLQTNVLGPFRLTKALLGKLSLQPGARVVFLSSDAAVHAYPGWGAYGVSKASSDHLMRSFAAENPEVQFLAFDPGEMDTEMHAAALPDTDRVSLRRPNDVARWIASALARPIASGTRVEVTL